MFSLSLLHELPDSVAGVSVEGGERVEGNFKYLRDLVD